MYASPSRSRCSVSSSVKVGRLPDPVERAPCAVGHAAVKVAIGIAIESSSGRIGRVLVDVRHLEGLAVVVRRVAAAMVNHDRVVLRHLVEIMNVQFAIVLDLGVVEEIPFDPGPRRCLTGFRAQFVHDAGDRHELHHVGIADQHVVEQRCCPERDCGSR